MADSNERIEDSLLRLEGDIQSADGKLHITIGIAMPRQAMDGNKDYYCTVTIPELEVENADVFSTQQKGAIENALIVAFEYIRSELLGGADPEDLELDGKESE